MSRILWWQQLQSLVVGVLWWVQNPDKFCDSVEEDQQQLRDRLTSATERLPDVELSRAVRLQISEVCLTLLKGTW